MMRSRGFTLIELLIVIGIIAILAAAVVLAINPGRQFAAARDATRDRHLNSLSAAFLAYRADNMGSLENLNLPGISLEICNLNKVEASECGNLVDLSDIAPGYISSLPVDPQGGINENGTGYFVTRGDPVLLEAVKAETRLSRLGSGENLVTNATGQYGNLLNFSQFDAFDTEEYYFEPGSFRQSLRRTRMTDEIVPVDANYEYEVCTYIKGEWEEGTTPRFYAGVVPYDADRRRIRPNNVRWRSGTDTFLAQPLAQGDTEIYLEDASNWVDFEHSYDGHRRTIGIYPYTNDEGYSYPAYTYTRHVRSNAWDIDAVDFEENIIYLNHSWNLSNPADPNGVWPAGTPVANHHSGGSYMYTAASNRNTPEEWTQFCGTIRGLSSLGGGSSSYFWQGTEYVRFLWLLNRTSGTDGWGDPWGDGNFSTTWIDGVSVTKTK